MNLQLQVAHSSPWSLVLNLPWLLASCLVWILTTRMSSQKWHTTHVHTHVCVYTQCTGFSHMCTGTFTNKYICEHTYMYHFQSSEEWEIDFIKSRRQIPYPNNTCILSLTGIPLALDLEKSAVALGCRDRWLIKISRGFHSFICFFQAEPLGGSRNSELTLWLSKCVSVLSGYVCDACASMCRVYVSCVRVFICVIIRVCVVSVPVVCVFFVCMCVLVYVRHVCVMCVCVCVWCVGIYICKCMCLCSMCVVCVYFLSVCVYVRYVYVCVYACVWSM